MNILIIRLCSLTDVFFLVISFFRLTEEFELTKMALECNSSFVECFNYVYFTIVPFISINTQFPKVTIQDRFVLLVPIDFKSIRINKMFARLYFHRRQEQENKPIATRPTGECNYPAKPMLKSPDACTTNMFSIVFTTDEMSPLETAMFFNVD